MVATERIDYGTGAQETPRPWLVRQGSEWTGSVVDFPPGSLTHYQPPASPGFFLARLPDGAWRALADRSPRFGRRLHWYNWPGSGRFDPEGIRAAGALCELADFDCYDVKGQPAHGPALPTGPVQFSMDTDADKIRVHMLPACSLEMRRGEQWMRISRGMPYLTWWRC
jgi:hypothetical protein